MGFKTNFFDKISNKTQKIQNKLTIILLKGKNNLNFELKTPAVDYLMEVAPERTFAIAVLQLANWNSKHWSTNVNWI